NISGIPPAENLQEIQKRYQSWFDIGFVPNNTEESEPSTIIEYVDTDDESNKILPYLRCLREGSIPFYEIKKNFHEPTIQFICTGNICRSPIAEYLFNHYSKEQNLPYSSRSAGLLETGALISLNSMQLLAEQGINASEHYSRKIDEEIMNSSWLVLTMEQRQRDLIIAKFPESAHKVFTLREYVGENGDIADPIGYDIDYYRDIYHQIDEAIQKLINRLTARNMKLD
ncbi:MAG: protein tyrosine phosphatase, partial [Candidatus Cloacimonetes bacterium]|nr:protein tyrosine phosphatase [Candidatus Cloacimonadota bacterium]